MTLNELMKTLEEDGCEIIMWDYVDEETLDKFDIYDRDDASSMKILLNDSPLYPSMVRWNPATRELNLTQEV